MAKSQKTGRPSKFSKKYVDEILEWLTAPGFRSLRKYCEQEGKPGRATIHKWLLDKDNQEFRDQYAQARQLQRDNIQEECIEISDDGRNDTYLDEKGNTRVDWDVVKRSELRISTRKWFAEQAAPKKEQPKTDERRIRPVFIRGEDRKSIKRQLAELEDADAKPSDN